MVYYGAVSDAPKLDVYTFLMKALSQSTPDMPYRGPEKYTDEMWLYENSLTGKIERFSGTEKIYYHGLCVYRADYIGGFIDRY